MGNIRHFRELDVYQLAMKAAMEIFELTKRFPTEERYSMTDQVRRSSRSVCTNTAEAWRKRRYPAAFVSKLSDAEAEAAETQVGWNWLYVMAISTRINPNFLNSNTRTFSVSSLL